MASTGDNTRRQFRVQKDSGDFWNMNFTDAGVKWEPTDSGFDDANGSLRSPPRGGGSSPLHAITSVVDTAANVGMWWEIRQGRLLNEAMNEESRRSTWLAEMIARWGNVHKGGNQLDLRVSEYLARETREMLEAIVANKRIALPQSILYELETIQDTFRSFRSLLLSQFEVLAEDLGTDLNGAVRKSLPSRKLDLGFIRSLGTDPTIEWADRVRAKATGEFDRDLTDALRNPSMFLARVFPQTEVEKPDPEDAEAHHGFVDRLVGLIAPALPRLLTPDPKTDASERRDAFRELSLLPAEISRVKALNSAWLATSAIVSDSSGGDVGVQVQVSERGVNVELAPTRTALELPSTGPKHHD